MYRLCKELYLLALCIIVICTLALPVGYYIFTKDMLLFIVMSITLEITVFLFINRL